MGLSSCTTAEHLEAMKMRLWSLLSPVVCDNSFSVIPRAVFFCLFFQTRFLEVLSSTYSIKFLPLNPATEVCTTFSFHLKCYNWVMRKLGSHTITRKKCLKQSLSKMMPTSNYMASTRFSQCLHRDRGDLPVVSFVVCLPKVLFLALMSKDTDTCHCSFLSTPLTSDSMQPASVSIVTAESAILKRRMPFTIL